MTLAITTNPHIKEPKKLWQILESQEKINEGKEYLDAELDPAQFEAFKKTVQRHSESFAVK